MSADNSLSIVENKEGFCKVKEILNGGKKYGGKEITLISNLTLREAIKYANDYRNRNIVEYGTFISLNDDR